jgi:hypothetical protein
MTHTSAIDDATAKQFFMASIIAHRRRTDVVIPPPLMYHELSRHLRPPNLTSLQQESPQ